MKKICLALFLLLILSMLMLPVSAEEVIWDYTAYEFTDTSGSFEKLNTNSGDTKTYNQLWIADISLHQTLNYVVFTIPKTTVGYNDNGDLLDSGRHEFTYTLKDQHAKLLVVYIERFDASTKVTLFFNNWDIESLSGNQIVDINGMYFMSVGGVGMPAGDFKNFPITVTTTDSRYHYYPRIPLKVDWTSGIEWENHIKLTELDPNPLGGYEFSLTRNIDGKYSQSECKIYNVEEIVFTDSSNTDIRDRWFSLDSITQINIESPTGRVYKFPVVGGAAPSEPENTAVTVYVRNSQTNAFIANANILISANVDGNFYEVVNKTVPSGIYSIDLQPTGGGKPNPDFYRLITTVEGYNSEMPYIDFDVDRKTTIYAYLNPIAGAPEDENKTFIDFYVRDSAANGISGATVKFGRYTLITNSAGYVMFEVDKNKTYSWTVSKSGYESLTGNAVIGSNARHTINTGIEPAVTPTKPTPIPTSTPISPTPTMTAPTGESVSNWLEWFAAHFGMILGGGVEIGKIFMWLCFTVPVGVYVGKEAKAGAAGFMAGAGIVTLFFVLIGWVPIWLMVLLALIIGLLYAKEFNNSDNGGGR